jgi:hypothetical protein
MAVRLAEKAATGLFFTVVAVAGRRIKLTRDCVGRDGKLERLWHAAALASGQNPCILPVPPGGAAVAQGGPWPDGRFR